MNPMRRFHWKKSVYEKEHREGRRVIIPVGPENTFAVVYRLGTREGRIAPQGSLSVRFVRMTGALNDKEKAPRDFSREAFRKDFQVVISA